MSEIPADPFAPGVDAVEIIGETDLHVDIDLPGALCRERLLDALAATCVAVPELGAIYRRRAWRSAWVIQEEPSWIVDEHAVEDEGSAARLERAFFALPPSAPDALPLRGLLLRRAGGDRLLLRVSHVLADGGGTKNLCYHIAQAYRRRGEDPTWRPAPSPPRRPLLRLAQAVPWRRPVAVMQGMLHELSASRPLRPIHVPMGPPAPGPKRLLTLHLPRARVEELRRRWRPRGVTINDLFCSALCRAVVRAFPEANAKRSHAWLLVTGDLRRSLPDRMDVCNFEAARPLPLGRLPLPAPEAQLARVTKETRIWKRGGTGALQTLGLIGIISLLPHGWVRGFMGAVMRLVLGRLNGAVGFTNIGPIDADRLDFGHGPCIRARISAPTAHAPVLMTALTGCAGALDFTLSFRETELQEAEVRRLLKLLDAELDALA
jgi:NRPS condensation-like uncharacterized protein